MLFRVNATWVSNTRMVSWVGRFGTVNSSRVSRIGRSIALVEVVEVTGVVEVAGAVKIKERE